VRGARPASRSGRVNAASLTSKALLDDSSRPPAASRQCPASAGRQAIARTAPPPPRALHPVVDPDQCRTRVPVVVRELLDLAGRDRADRGHPVRRELTGPLRQRVESERVLLDELAIQPALAHQHVDQPQRQRAVGPRHRRNVVMTLFGGQRAVRIDRDQARPAALGLLGPAPEVQVGGHRVGAPEYEQPAVLDLLEVGSQPCTERERQRLRAGRGADGAVQAARAQPVEQSLRHCFALHQTHGAGVAVRHDALRVAGRDPAEPQCDVAQRLVPSGAFEAP